MNYRNKHGMIMKPIYIRKIWQNSFKLLQFVIFGLVFSLVKSMSLIDGGDKKWHFGIKYRSSTNL